ncbi:MAG: intradiol ring-cleavage dioxygenase [Bacteroidota bacterium]
MKRKHFIKKGLLSISTLIGIPVVASACKKNETDPEDLNCPRAPVETAGPFPIRTPTELMRANIAGDRTGVALLIQLNIKNAADNCQPLAGALVDIWYCDKDGNYSEYGNHRNSSFLRGRQSTDANGQVAFIGIYPGWYPGRAPHLHVEVLDSKGKSMRITQIAFPEAINEAVYASEGYRGPADTSNDRDGLFRDSLDANMANEISGNNTEGYTLIKDIIV